MPLESAFPSRGALMGTPDLEHHVAAAIASAQLIYERREWCMWATKWLSKTDRSAVSAEAAYDAAEQAMRTAKSEEECGSAARAALAAQLAIELAEAERLRAVGDRRLADILEHTALTIAEAARRASIRTR